MNDADVTTLALGTDLTSLGLHLNGMDALYLTFASPWADGPIKPEPVFKVGSEVLQLASTGSCNPIKLPEWANGNATTAIVWRLGTA